MNTATVSKIESRFGSVSFLELVKDGISEKDARQDFSNLLNAPPILNQSRLGLKLNKFCSNSQLYKASRYTVDGSVRRSLYDAWKKKDIRKKIFEALLRLYPGINVAEIRSKEITTAYSLLYGYVGYFKPMVAKYIFSTYSKSGSVVDFCAGWGGRLIGALAAPNVVSYIGIDTNTNMAPSYTCIQRIAAKEGVTKNIQIIHRAAESVDYSKLGKYDCVFTSPPYFGIEKYDKMPIYNGKEDWMNRFLFKTLGSICNSIDPNGFICINIRQETTETAMVKYMKSMGWIVKKKLLMKIAAMPGRGSHKSSVDYGEPIYIFKKMQRVSLA